LIRHTPQARFVSDVKEIVFIAMPWGCFKPSWKRLGNSAQPSQASLISVPAKSPELN
jgi:hypothetical protein